MSKHLLILLTIFLGGLTTEAFSTSFLSQQPRATIAFKGGRGSSSTTSPSSLHMTLLSFNGKKKDFKPGSPLKEACRQLGVPVKYSCLKGDCATCQISLGGNMSRACIGKVPPEPKLQSIKEKGLEIRA